MIRRAVAALLLSLYAAVALCAGLKTKDVKGRIFLAEGSRDVAGSVGVDSLVTLDFGRYAGGIKKDGSFTIHNVPTGLYILDVTSVTHIFEKLWVEVDATEGVVRASTYMPGAEYDTSGRRAVSYPLELQQKGTYDYFMVREGFNWWALASNPMLLMAGFSIVMVYALPKMMDSIPPEELQASRDAQARLLGGNRAQ